MTPHSRAFRLGLAAVAVVVVVVICTQMVVHLITSGP